MSTRLGYPRRKLRSDLRDWIADSRTFVVQMLALGLGLLAFGICAAVWWPRTNDFLQGLITGAALVALLAMSAAAFFLNTGSQYRLVGAWAEDSTETELKAAATADDVHGYVTHIELAGYDIDALAVTASGVLAIETKWHRVNPSARQLGRDVESALGATAKTRSILRSLGAADVPVHGLLVVWGPGTGDVVTDHGGVHIVSGDRLLEALRHTTAGEDLSVGDGNRLTEQLEDFAETNGLQVQLG